MSQIVITGGHVVTPLDERLTDVTIADGKVVALGPAGVANSAVTTLNATGCWVTPGLFDLQVNGGTACDFWGDPDLEQVTAFADELCRCGVTSILPTLITDDIEHLRKNIEFLGSQLGVGVQQLQPESSLAPAAASGRAGGAKAAVKHRALPVRMPGIHLEGPCLSPEKPGVHPPQHIAPLSLAILERIILPPVKLITLAPEKDPSHQTLQWLRQSGVQIALGHSNATYEEAHAAFDNGVSLMTHTFNALPPIHHRSPGAVTAALLDDRVWCCVICDGLHVSEPAVALALRAKGINRSILVTDIAHVGTTAGGLVGSSITLDKAVRNVVNWGLVSFQDAILMASFNPAAAMGWHNEIGHLAPGKAADVVVWDKQTLSIKHVVSRGEVIF